MLDVAERYRFREIPGLVGYDFALPVPYALVVRSEDPTAPATDLVHAFSRHLTRTGRGGGWCRRTDQPASADEARALEAEGFRPRWTYCGMAAPVAAVVLPASAEVAVAEVELARALEEVAVISESLPGQSELLRRQLPGGYREDGYQRRFLLASDVDGRTVGMTVLDVSREASFAHLRHTAVHPEHRGRGIYRRLLAERIRHCRREGIETAVAHTIDGVTTEKVQRLGFEPVTRYAYHERSSDPRT